jgi:hypothetical protein
MIKIHVAFLRKPRGLGDKREDPMWEFGAFGLTGCHSHNLLNPNNCVLADGARILFIQGGRGELRAVGLTPPIRVVIREVVPPCYIQWDKNYRPIPFDLAPILIDNKGNTHFPAMQEFLQDVNRSTLVAKAASKLRSRTASLDGMFSQQIINLFDKQEHSKITCYMDAIVYKDSKWYRNARELGWGDLKTRRERFEALTNRQPSGACVP